MLAPVSLALTLVALAAAPVGSRAEGVVLRDGDADGGARRLDDLAGAGPVVVVFLAVECPLARAYAPKLAALDREFSGRGVRFVGVDPNPLDTPDELSRFAREHGITFPMLRDDGPAAARLGATRTPEAVVLDGHRVIRYRGRVDDQLGVGSERPGPTRRDLAEALGDLLAGRAVAVPEAPAVGCPIPRPAPEAAQAVEGPSYSGAVAEILRRRCLACHAPGRVAPFSLANYRQARRWASAVVDAVDAGRMPPWHADPRYGRFANDPGMTPEERAALARWAEAGCPEGDPATPAPTTLSAAEEWSIPGPDLVAAMPRAFDVPASGEVPYQSFEIDPGFREDRWVRAAEILPGRRSVVHHATVYLRPPGSPDLAAPGELGSGCLALYTPGGRPFALPDGMAKRVPAGWRLVLVVHYAPDGRARADRTRIGLTFAAPGSVTREVATRSLTVADLCIPARAASHRVEAAERLGRDILLLAMLPHMHLRGRSFRYEAAYPDGRTEVLLDVPRYDFHWQHRYELAEPKLLPSGTTLRCVARYDNSAGNPSNPDPGATVRTGERSADEMFNGYYDAAPVAEGPPRPPSWPARLRAAAPSLARRLPVAALVGCGGLWLARRGTGRARPSRRD